VFWFAGGAAEQAPSSNAAAMIAGVIAEVADRLMSPVKRCCTFSTSRSPSVRVRVEAHGQVRRPAAYLAQSPPERVVVPTAVREGMPSTQASRAGGTSLVSRAADR
jgi:hypothetical protein